MSKKEANEKLKLLFASTNASQVTYKEVKPTPVAEEAPASDARGKNDQRGKRKPRHRSFKNNTKPNNVPRERDPEQEERTVFVGNVPQNCTEKKIRALFRQHGKIETVRFRGAAVKDEKMSKKVAIITRTFHEERSSIIAFVRFETIDMAKAALELNGHVLDDHHLRVDTAVKSTKLDGKKTVFVGNLPVSVEEEALWKFFGNCGDLECVRVTRDNATGIGKGVAFITFKKRESAAEAVKLNGETFENRKLVVERHAKKPRPKVAVEARGKKHSATREYNGKKYEYKKISTREFRAKRGGFSGTKASESKHKKSKKLTPEELKKKKLAKLLEWK